MDTLGDLLPDDFRPLEKATTDIIVQYCEREPQETGKIILENFVLKAKDLILFYNYFKTHNAVSLQKYPLNDIRKLILSNITDKDYEYIDKNQNVYRSFESIFLRTIRSDTKYSYCMFSGLSDALFIIFVRTIDRFACAKVIHDDVPSESYDGVINVYYYESDD